MLCGHCGLEVDGPGCNTQQAEECPNREAKAQLGEEPDTDRYYGDDDSYR